MPMGPEDKKKLLMILAPVGVLLVVLVVLFILHPWNKGEETGGGVTPAGGTGSSSAPALGSGPTTALNTSGPTEGSSASPAPASPSPAPASAGATPPPSAPTPAPAAAKPVSGGAASAPAPPPPGSPIERYRVDPMQPFTRPPLPPSLVPVFTAARAPWRGQGVEGLPQIRLTEFSPPPRVPGGRPEGLPDTQAATVIDDGQKRLAGFMMTNANMIWVIMEVVSETGTQYYVLKPGDLLKDTPYQVVRFERFQDKDDKQDKVRVVLKDNATQAMRYVVLRPSPQPQEQAGAGMGGEGGMGMPGMPGMGMPGMGMPGMPGMGGYAGGGS